ncbi:MerR family transcriptional regulator [Novosphingobium aquae]|uniref:MerR family transcriptional regulator n=1 Tax=Novosphingobium aquae TaxID=3133435 RepID=A0ABU8S3Y6_9SPHN
MSEEGALQFDARKAPDALRTIGEVAKAIGIRQHVLRYWEEQFPMLKPLKRSGGRRYYRSEDVAMVESIDRLVHKEGYTLKGAKAVLSGKGPGPERAPAAAQVALAPVSSGSGIPVAALMEIRNRLAAALAA